MRINRRTATPLLIGSFILRTNSSASTIILGLLLAQITTHTEHAITSLQVGLLPVAFYCAELTLAPFMGSLSDRWGRRYFLLVGPFFGLIQAALLFLTPTINPLPFLLIMQVLSGIAGALTVPAVLSYLADLTVQDQTKRIRLMSFYELVTSGGIAIGTVVGGLLWDQLGRIAFLVLACGYSIVLCCMFLAPVVTQTLNSGNFRHTAARYWHILRMPRLFLFTPAWLCISALVGIWLSSQLIFILSTPSNFPQQLLMGSMREHGGSLGLILGAYVLFFGLCLLFWAFFLNRVPRIRLMLLSVVGVYLVCLALFGINHRGGANELLFIWVPLLLIGIFAETSFAPAALAYLADVSEDAARDRGLVMGLYSIFLSLGQILGNGLGGVFAHSFGFDGLIYLTALLAGIALISLMWLVRQEPRFSKVHI